MIELLGLEPAGDVVEVEVARRDPRDRVPRLGAGGDPVHRLRHHVAQLDRLARALVLGDGEDPPLGVLEQLLGGEVVRVAVLEDLAGALDQGPADGLLADDLRVVLGVGGVRDAPEDLRDDLVAADRLELIAPDQLLGDGDRVDRLAQVVEVADRPVEDLVAVAVEVLDVEQADDVVEDVVVEQDAAQHALLGLEVLRGQADGSTSPIRPARSGRGRGHCRCHSVAIAVA